MGVVLAITPVTNPTSTVLFKAIVAMKTRNAMIFRPSTHGDRVSGTCGRGAAVLPGRPQACLTGALQVLPQAEHEYTYALFDHPGVDLIWTTGGPRIVETAEQGRQADHQRRSG